MFSSRRDINFLKNYVLVYGIDFQGDLPSQSLCFEDLKQVKIIENGPNYKDCRNGLGQGPGIGESLPEMALGSKSAPNGSQCGGRAGATKTAILNIISFSNLRICCFAQYNLKICWFAQSSTRPEALRPRRI